MRIVNIIGFKDLMEDTIVKIQTDDGTVYWGSQNILTCMQYRNSKKMKTYIDMLMSIPGSYATPDDDLLISLWDEMRKTMLSAVSKVITYVSEDKYSVFVDTVRPEEMIIRIARMKNNEELGSLMCFKLSYRELNDLLEHGKNIFIGKEYRKEYPDLYIPSITKGHV
jgi:hypothetical protein